MEILWRSNKLQDKGPERFENGKPFIIAGIDPGLTVGLAIIDLRGRLLYLGSMKEASRSDIINRIIEHGRAIVVASDVHPAPEAVRRIASMLNAKLCTPERVLTISFKNELVSEFLSDSESTPENSHERDALAAAVRAYRHHEMKLRQIEKKLEDLDIGEADELKIKGLVITGKPVAEAIKLVTDRQEPVEVIREQAREKPEADIDKLKRTLRTQRSTIKHQRLLIEKLENENRSLKKRIRELRDEKSRLKSKLDRLHYEYSRDLLLNRELSHKLKVIDKLQKKYNEEKSRRMALERNLDSLLRIRDMEFSPDKTPVKIIDTFTRDGIRRACSKWKIKRGDVLLLRSPEGGGSQTASILRDIGPRAIITEDKMSHQALEVLEDGDIPVISARSIDVEIYNDFGSVRTQDLNTEIKKWKNRLNEKRKKREEEELLKLIDQYRAQRRRK